MTIDNFAIIKAILPGIDAQLDNNMICRDAFDHKAIGCTENRWKWLLEIMCEDGLVRGSICGQESLGASAGKPSIDNLRITLKGLEYLRSVT
jgi:hypothetical protein